MTARVRAWARLYVVPLVAALLTASLVGGLALAGGYTGSGGGHGGGGLSIVNTSGAGLSGQGTVGNPLVNSGVTSIVAGTSVSISGATGAVTVNYNMTPNTAGDGQTVTTQAANGKVSWGQPTVDYKDGVTYFDDFFTPGVNNAMWSSANSGTGSGCSASTSIVDGGWPGIGDCSTGTASTGVAMLVSGGGAGNTSESQVVFGSGVWTFEAKVGFPTLSNSTDGYSWEGGFLDTANVVGQVDGCYFVYDERNATGFNAGNASNWIVACAANSVRKSVLLDGVTTCENSFGTSVASTVAAETLPSTNVYKLKIVINAGGTVAQFFINDVEVCDLTTDVPNGTARVTAYGIAQRKSVGTTARDFIIDWARVRLSLTTPRT